MHRPGTPRALKIVCSRAYCSLTKAPAAARPEAQSPTMEMYLFGVTARFRKVNGGDDAAILFHEYTHGLTDRLVGFDADGGYLLTFPQGDAMAEGFSDFYAKSYIVERGLETDDAAVPGQIDMGVYTDAQPHALRSEPLDCPARAPSDRCPNGGYTYGHFGAAPEAHAAGEIWAQTLWDLRTGLGTDLTTRVVTWALPLAPDYPTFLEM